MHDLSPGGELLQWASEMGSGRWGQFRASAEHLARKHGLIKRPWNLARELSSLGHLDIDWEARRWSIAKPTLNVVPGLGLCVVLTGSRPYHFLQSFRDAVDDPSVFDFQMRQSEPHESAPAAIFAKCANLEVVEKVASRTNARFVVDPSTSLAASMPFLGDQQLVLAAPPDLDLDTEWFNPYNVEWEECEDRGDPKEGLYRQALTERRRHLWHEADRWWKTDLAYGQFRALQGEGQRVMKWQSATTNGGQSSRLEVRRYVRLPDLAERALTICDGRMPSRGHRPDGDGHVYERYSNVPEGIYHELARKLGQLPTTEGGGEVNA